MSKLIQCDRCKETRVIGPLGLGVIMTKVEVTTIRSQFYDLCTNCANDLTAKFMKNFTLVPE